MSQAVERNQHPRSKRLAEVRAARLRGRSRADFVRDAAVRAPEDVLIETAPIRMTAAGFEAFVAALSGPATSVSEMVELFKRVAPWETGGSDAAPISTPSANC